MKEKMFHNDIFQIDGSYYHKIYEKCGIEYDFNEIDFGIDTSGLFDFNQELPYKTKEELKREERKAKLEEIFNNEL